MFAPSKYGEDVARILALDGGGSRIMPLTIGECTSAEARRIIRISALPDVVRAGLFFYFNCWTDSHHVAQNIETPDGSYWHALIHRQEPDAFNAGYWFQRVGSQHAIYPAIRKFAATRGVNFGLIWDPKKFIDYCLTAAPGSDEARKAQEVQLVEWQLLFDHCAVAAAKKSAAEKLRS
jgi:hypothetical protein